MQELAYLDPSLTTPSVSMTYTFKLAPKEKVSQVALNICE